MFSKWSTENDDVNADNNGTPSSGEKKLPAGAKKESIRTVSDNRGVNTILKGSKLSGDINVICDLELSGDVEGNITSLQDSNIVIKGSCKGNIETKEGNVDIEGELKSGNITAGGNVNISGKFSSGEVKARGRVHVNGEFNGRLEGNEIEIGPEARGKGDILYKEYISIARGAKIEAQVSKLAEDMKDVKSSTKDKVVEIQTPKKEAIKSN